MYAAAKQIHDRYEMLKTPNEEERRRFQKNNRSAINLALFFRLTTLHDLLNHKENTICLIQCHLSLLEIFNQIEPILTPLNLDKYVSYCKIFFSIPSLHFFSKQKYKKKRNIKKKLKKKETKNCIRRLSNQLLTI